MGFLGIKRSSWVIEICFCLRGGATERMNASGSLRETGDEDEGLGSEDVSEDPPS